MDEELLPCPFCGVVPYIADVDDDLQEYWVRCRNPECNVRPATHIRRSKETVIRYWNTRAMI